VVPRGFGDLADRSGRAADRGRRLFYLTVVAIIGLALGALGLRDRVQAVVLAYESR
jgi:hypothetical protein